MIEKYRQRVIEHIWLFLVLLFICIAGIIGFMSKVKIITGDNLISTNIINAAGKFIISFFVLFIMAKWDFFCGFQVVSKKKLVCALVCGFPFIIDIVENIALLKLVPASLIQADKMGIISVLLLGLGTACVEEFGVRGVLYSLFCLKWKNKKNSLLKAALFVSAVFGLLHFGKLLYSLLFLHIADFGEIIASFYQVITSFCAGMLFTGMTVYSKSLIPAVVWHTVIDISAFLYQGIVSEITYLMYMGNATWVDVLYQIGIPVKNGSLLFLGVSIITNLIYVMLGVILIEKEERLFLPNE